MFWKWCDLFVKAESLIDQRYTLNFSERSIELNLNMEARTVHMRVFT